MQDKLDTLKAENTVSDMDILREAFRLYGRNNMGLASVGLLAYLLISGRKAHLLRMLEQDLRVSYPTVRKYCEVLSENGLVKLDAINSVLYVELLRTAQTKDAQ